MPEQIRALIVILIIATAVFFYQKKAIAPLLHPDEFTRWRNAWFVITLLAFLSLNFWLFIVLSTLYLIYIEKSEQNKFALYCALFLALPTFQVRIPFLLDISYVRLLSLTILLTFFLKFKANPNIPALGKPIIEKLLIGLLILDTLLTLRSYTFTNTMRYGFHIFIDIFLPYYVASRAIKDFEQLKKVMIALVMVSLVIAAISIFEYSKGWLLYGPLENALKVESGMGNYLARAGNVRAITSLDHPIVLGFVMAVALGFYLFIASLIISKTQRLIGYALIVGGLVASISKGPWIGAAVLFLVYTAYGKNVIRRFSILAIATIFALPVINMIPGGEKIISLIPFVGEVGKENIEYREKLIDRSILLIKRNPLFGVSDPRVEPEMADMVQGEGIVDIVNSYVGIATTNGLVGLSLFLGFFSMILVKLNKSMKKIANKTSEEYLCGRSLLATMVAVLVIILTASSISIIPFVYWSLAGLIISYVRVANPIILIERFSYPTDRAKQAS